MTCLLWILLCLSAGLMAAITDGSGVNSSILVVGGLKVPDNLLSKILGNISKFPFTSTHTADRFEVFLMSFFWHFAPQLLTGLVGVKVPEVTGEGIVGFEFLLADHTDMLEMLEIFLEILVVPLATPAVGLAVELEFVFLKQLELRETDLRNDNISVLNILSSQTLSLSLTLQISQVLMLPDFLFPAFLATALVNCVMLTASVGWEVFTCSRRSISEDKTKFNMAAEVRREITASERNFTVTG